MGPAVDVGLEPPVADDDDFNLFEGGGLVSLSSALPADVWTSRSVRCSTELSRLMIRSLGAETEVLRLEIL